MSCNARELINYLLKDQRGVKPLHPYFQQIVDTINHLPMQQIDKGLELLYNAYLSRKQIFTLGNGGSATTAIHFAGDLNKTTITKHDAPRFRARSLAENITLCSAWANDYGYVKVFSEQLINFMEAGDIVFAISGSGNSPNVIAAVEVAKQKGGKTIGLCGFSGGQLGRLADVPILCPNNNMLMIEDLHTAICHYYTYCLIKRLAESYGDCSRIGD